MLNFIKSKSLLTLATCSTLLLFTYSASAGTADGLIEIRITKNGNNLGVEVVPTASIGGTQTDVKLQIKKDSGSFVDVRKEGEAPYEWGTKNQNRQDPELLNMANGTYELKAIINTGNHAGKFTTKSTTIVGTRGTSSNGSMRGAFYYIWYPHTFSSGGKPLKYTLSSGQYNSSDANAIKRHIREMEYADIDFGIISWAGTSKHPKKGNILTGINTNAGPVLKTTKEIGSSFKWAIYYEQERDFDPSVSVLKADLAHIKKNFIDPYPDQYLKVNGKPVIFIYDGVREGNDIHSYSNRWFDATAGDWYYVPKVYSGYKDSKKQPSAWHQYGAPSDLFDVTTSTKVANSANIVPGFKHCDSDRNPLYIARDLNKWKAAIRKMNSSGAKWHLITSYNEWCEGTAIEPAKEWKSNSGYGTYIDALHDDPLNN